MGKKVYLVTVKGNEGYCGIDAGGVQFANGEAIVGEGRILDWFRDTDGYEIEELKEEGDSDADDSGGTKKPTTQKK